MDVKLPHLGEGADSGTVINLLVKEGDRIEKDQAILELENEKAVATIPTTAAGVVSKLYVKTGDKISAGQRLISVAEAGGSAAPAASPAPAAKSVRAETRVAPAPGPVVVAPENGAAEHYEEPPASDVSVAAAPSIRMMAGELGIDLTRIRGSGRGGRIVLADVREYIQRLMNAARQPKTAAPGASAKPVAESIDFSKWGAIVKKPLTPLRKVISRRMAENWNAIPHVTQFDEADITELEQLRASLKDKAQAAGVKLTPLAFIMRACVKALQAFPRFNSALDPGGANLIVRQYLHIGFAADTPQGLIVPVVKDANRKDIYELARQLGALSEKARAGKLPVTDMQGGCFTISSLGGIGGTAFTPIINAPEVAILGVSRASMRGVFHDGGFIPRLLLPLSLSYDHRVIDGAMAARFTSFLAQTLAEPRALIEAVP
jgi:pyruvate dehydrogenase E2 component (dihydrolipoamide acetyltransferase)